MKKSAFCRKACTGRGFSITPLGCPHQVYGKWYAIALGTTCKWLKKYKERYLMGTLVVAPGDTSNELSVTSTRLR